MQQQQIDEAQKKIDKLASENRRLKAEVEHYKKLSKQNLISDLVITEEEGKEESPVENQQNEAPKPEKQEDRVMQHEAKLVEATQEKIENLDKQLEDIYKFT